MLAHLPTRHRRTLAALSVAVAVIAGTWVSTRVGDPTPEAWGVALGLLAGAVTAALLLRGRAGPPARP